MSLNKIIAFTIVVSFAVYEHVQSDALDDFTLEKYLGKWYEIAEIRRGSTRYTCRFFNVTRGNRDDGSFNEISHLNANGQQIRLDVHGKVINSRLHLTYPLDNGSYDLDFIVKSKNNGQELILVDSGDKRFSGLISRTPTASIDAKSEFEILAALAGYEVTYINNINCPEVNN